MNDRLTQRIKRLEKAKKRNHLKFEWQGFSNPGTNRQLGNKRITCRGQERVADTVWLEHNSGEEKKKAKPAINAAWRYQGDSGRVRK